MGSLALRPGDSLTILEDGFVNRLQNGKFPPHPAIQATGLGRLPRWDLLPLIMPAFAGRTLIGTNPGTIGHFRAPCLLRPPTFAGWISGICICVRICLQSRDLQDESLMRFRRSLHSHDESRSILLEWLLLASD